MEDSLVYLVAFSFFEPQSYSRVRFIATSIMYGWKILIYSIIDYEIIVA